MGGGRILATFVLSLAAGMVIGAVLYNNYYHVSERILEEYDLFFMLLPSIATFFAGLFAGRAGRKQTVEFRFMYQGRPQNLGREGEKILAAALRRAGIVKEG